MDSRYDTQIHDTTHGTIQDTTVVACFSIRRGGQIHDTTHGTIQDTTPDHSGYDGAHNSRQQLGRVVGTIKASQTQKASAETGE